MSRRSDLAHALDRFGMLDAFLRARTFTRWPRASLTVLAYHRVLERSDLGELDPDLVDATPATFDEQMGLLRRHLSPVGLAEVLAAATPGGAPLPPHPVLVTFDDGYRDNLEIAAPILKRHGMRAAFFVATDYMTTPRLFWWERIHVIMSRTRVPSLELTYPHAISIPMGDAEGRRLALRAVRNLAKDCYDLDIERYLEALSVAAEVPWPRAEDERRAREVMLDWDGVLALRDAGMDVASHTCGHRVLQTLTPSALERELRESKATLEARLGAAVRAVAYPVGRSIVGSPQIARAVRDAGYDLGFAVQPGANAIGQGTGQRGLGDEALLDLKRIPVDGAWSTARFRAALIHHALAD